MKNIFCFILVVLFSFSGFSQQKSINSYKYFIVNNKFDFLKKENQYKTSSYTKVLFDNAGFITFLSDDNLPNEVTKNRCNALFVDVKEISSFLTIKNQIEIKDCNNQLLFKSKVGKSKIKDYKRGYFEAIKEAFKSVKELNYSYQPITEAQELQVADTKETTSKIADVTLYAQPIQNGFQLVNAEPKVVMLLLKTQVEDIFIIKDKNGVMYNKNGFWIAEFYEKGVLKVKKYQIKF